jgi:hypothetical protein
VFANIAEFIDKLFRRADFLIDGGYFFEMLYEFGRKEGSAEFTEIAVLVRVGV